MLDFTGIECPVCKKAFTESDDVVVCPTCGAPYHRQCYVETGHCIFEENHKTGKNWQAPKKDTSQSPDIKSVECPVCGTLNTKESLYCNICGTPLTQNSPQNNNRANNPVYPQSGNQPNQQDYQKNQYNVYGAGSPFSYDPMGGVSPTETLEDDITYGDASKFVKTNTAYYMPIFRNIKQVNKSRFNFAAFIFTGGWMLYRKQYKIGAIVTSIMYALYITFNLTSIYLQIPIFNSLLNSIGVSSGTTSLTSSQIFEIAEILVDNPLMYFQFILPTLCLLAMFVVMIVVGARGNRMYMKHCVKSLKEIKSNADSYDVGVTIDVRGGLNAYAPLVLLVINMVTMFLINGILLR